MESCCNLGSEFQKKSNILYETDNFFLVPAIGQMGIEGYLLLCSKKHFIGVGGTPKKYNSELEDALKTTRKILSETYDSDTIVFEHGPRIGCHRGGGCLDHSHLHVLPFNGGLMEPLVINLLNGLGINYFYKLERVENFERLHEIYKEQKTSYLFIETAGRERYATEVNFPIPSQYLRQIIASKLNRGDKWDWRQTPDAETFEKTIDQLKNKF